MRNVVGTAAAHRHANRLLVPLFSNAAFSPFLKNLVCSMRRLDVHNWMAVAMDNTTCPSLSRGGFLTSAAEAATAQHACVEPYAMRPLVGASTAAYGSAPFWRLVVQRPLWIRWLLTQDYTVLQCDVDVVWMNNPLPHLASPRAFAPPKSCSHPASIFGARNISGQIRWRQKKEYQCPHANSTLMVQSELSCRHAGLEPATGRAAAAADDRPLLPRTAAWLLTPRVRVAHPKTGTTAAST
jgi:hypothetical protein